MIKAMRLIKNAFDPHGIMNPYKVLPPEHWLTYFNSLLVGHFLSPKLWG
jgi:hypothetical protein